MVEIHLVFSQLLHLSLIPPIPLSCITKYVHCPQASILVNNNIELCEYNYYFSTINYKKMFLINANTFKPCLMSTANI